MQDRIKSLVALAAPSVAIGVFLFARGYTKAGWTLIGFALLIFAIAIFSLVVPACVSVLLWASAPLRWIVSHIWKFVSRTFSRTRKKVYSYLLPGATTNDFVAQTPRAYMHSQQADYKLIHRPEGAQFRGLGLVIRPDYESNYWRAGFRLVRTSEDLSQGDIRDTVLFHISVDSWASQPLANVFVRRQGQQTGIQHYGQVRYPTFRISANVWATPSPLKFRVSVTVEAPPSSPLEVEFDVADMGSVALIAWGDGKPFRVFFDDVKIYWR